MHRRYLNIILSVSGVALMLGALSVLYPLTIAGIGSIGLSSLLLMGMLSLLKYFYRYVKFTEERASRQILLRITPSLIALTLAAGCYLLIAYLMEESRTLVKLLPLVAWCWCIVVIAVQAVWSKEECEPLPDEEQEETPSPESHESYTDTVTVKIGKRLQLIPCDTILYLQGDGDYVSIVTTEGRYLKEATLKAFEQSLSQNNFTRIHRSYIVNHTAISSIELYAKQQYQITIKNGDKIKSTDSGYRLLRQKIGF